MKTHYSRALHVGYFVAGTLMSATIAFADVTIEQKNTLDVASVIKAHGSTTTNIAGDKQREDSESHCEGMMSLVCGNLHGGEIVRLDRGVTWHLEPDKKAYREDAFASPEELAAMRAKMQARLEKMRSCPVSQKQAPIDKSKCEMSAPKIDVHRTDDKMSIAGHDSQRTVATLTESCTNKETGDVCDTVIAVDTWLTQDKLPGSEDRRAFQLAYAKKLGLDDPQGALRGEFAKFLAPYQSQIKELTAKSGDFKGSTLRTTLRVMMGGQQCSTVAKMKPNDSTGTDTTGGSNSPISSVAQAGKALGSSVGNLVGGLFKKKKVDDAQAAASAAPTVSATSPSTPAPAVGAADPYTQYVQMASFTTETVAINVAAVPADRFEVPSDWKKVAPKASKLDDDDFTCPKSAN